MILAAGLGTRLRPITSQKPKALVEINGIPLLQIAIERLKKFGFKEIIINVHHFADQVIEFLKAKNFFDINLQISDESKLLLDTGGALKKASWFFDKNKPFLVQNVDVLTSFDLATLKTYHMQTRPLATLLVQQRPSSRQLLFDQRMRLAGWQNHQTHETRMSDDAINPNTLTSLAFCGIHVIEPKLFDYFPPEEVFPIIPTYLKAATDHRISGLELKDDRWIDVGKPQQLKEAQEKHLEKS